MQLKFLRLYFNNKEADAKKQAALAEEAKIRKAKYTPVIAKKLAYFAEMKAERTTTQVLLIKL
jgi:hypothetical protein